MSKKSTALYRNLISEAARLTWQRKMLWVFGIFAALISTGGVIDIVFATVKKVKVGGNLLEQLMSSSFFGYEIASQYISQLQVVGTTHMAGILTAITLIGILLVVMAVVSQGALVLGMKIKHAPNPHEINKETHKHFWDLLTIATLTKAASALLVILMTLPLLLFYVQTTQYNAFLFFFTMLLFVPAVLVVHIISILALVDIVHKNRTAVHAIEHAWRVFVKHWVATFEFALILFFISLAAGTILFVSLSVLSIPYAIFYTASLLSGSYNLFLIVNVLSGLAVILIVLLFGGALTTFQYTSWYVFYKHATHKTHGRHPFARILRLLRH
jgi:hypothetical protein